MAEHKSEIKIDITLDENKVPEQLKWSAPDGGVMNEETKAVMLNVWEPNAQELLRIDLWTKDMPMDQMKKFYYQIYMSMADSFERATNEEEMALDMKDFARYFGEKQDVIKPRK
ncbi:MAG: gliding motility protein GldC [Schleiferiaceae bacterium]|jgi:gliding motility-associated protein GldC|nr:gliding motility protein GldC [Schleiferiaceae bacterium]